MKTYLVRLEEVEAWEVEVRANSKAEAETKAKESDFYINNKIGYDLNVISVEEQ